MSANESSSRLYCHHRAGQRAHQRTHKSTDRAEISTLNRLRHIKRIKLIWGQHSEVLSSMLSTFSAPLKHNSAKSTISRFVKLLMAPAYIIAHTHPSPTFMTSQPIVPSVPRVYCPCPPSHNPTPTECVIAPFDLGRI